MPNVSTSLSVSSTKEKMTELSKSTTRSLISCRLVWVFIKLLSRFLEIKMMGGDTLNSSVTTFLYSIGSLISQNHFQYIYIYIQRLRCDKT